MSNARTGKSISRRTALAGLGAGGAGLAMAAAVRSASAQDAATEMANHPLVGTWLGGTNVNDLQLVHWAADGNMDFQASVAPTVTDGVTTYNDTAMGVWEPDGERGMHITFTWATRDANGAVTGTTTVDGYPVASEDGNSYVDDGTRVVLTLRDPAGAVTQEITGVPRVTGVRVVPGKPGYEEVLALIAAAASATPAP
jgi:hypothetical protein